MLTFLMVPMYTWLYPSSKNIDCIYWSLINPSESISYLGKIYANRARLIGLLDYIIIWRKYEEVRLNN